MVPGLDAAGKSTIIYKLKLGETVSTIPTIGFNVETIKYKSVEMTMWDVGGQAKIRRLWNHYVAGTNAVIYAVDAADRERISDAAEELKHIMDMDGMEDCVLLVYANKQDLPDALNAEQLAREMKLSDIAGRRDWYCQGAIATSGQGLYDGLDWMTERLMAHRRG